MKTLLIAIIVMTIFSGCAGDPAVVEGPAQANVPKAETTLRFCTQLSSPGSSIKHAKPHATFLKSTKWPNDIRFPLSLTVRFLNGRDFQKQKVMQYAKEWNLASASTPDRGSKIRIKFIPYDVTTPGNVADIRIMFQDGKGSSSYVGTEAKRIAQDQPTMFYGWVTEDEPEQWIRQVVLHEFGHALGFVHEHQSPVGDIPWDKEAVYDYYHRTQDPPWTRPQVDANVFARYDSNSTNHTAYDSTSIMHYGVPDELTIGDFSIPWNLELSPTDLAFVKEIYKYTPCTVNEDCCFDKKTGKEILCP